MGRRVRTLRVASPRRPAGAGASDLSSDEGIRAAYEAHGGELYRFAAHQLRDEGAAQDAVQEVFVRAWRSAPSYDPSIAGLRTWLFTIARNVVIDEARRRRARPWLRDLVAEPEDRVGQTNLDEAVMDGWLIEEALRRLSEEHRTAIVATQLSGRSYGEIAAELGVPVGTVRSRVFYGLKAMRVAMDEMGVTL